MKLFRSHLFSLASRILSTSQKRFLQAQNEKGSVGLFELMMVPVIGIVVAFMMISLGVLGQAAQPIAALNFIVKVQSKDTQALQDNGQPVSYLSLNKFPEAEQDKVNKWLDDPYFSLEVDNSRTEAHYTATAVDKGGAIFWVDEENNEEVLAYHKIIPEEGSHTAKAIALAVQKAWKDNPSLELKLGGEEVNGEIVQVIMTHYKEQSKIKLKDNAHYGGSQASISQTDNIQSLGALGIGNDSSVSAQLAPTKTPIRSTWWGTGEDAHYVSVFKNNNDIRYVTDNMTSSALIKDMKTSDFLYDVAKNLASSF